MSDEGRRRRRGMAHGDNTAGAFRYAPPLPGEFHASHTGPQAAVPGGGPSLVGAPKNGVSGPKSWLQGISLGLPMQLVPLIGSLPGMVNNMRDAQRSVEWWRFFHGLDDSLRAQLQQKPALQQAQKQRESLAVRQALCEARFNLSFNAVELLSYATGFVPLLLHGVGAQRGVRLSAMATRVLPMLLLASGLLHVVQRASWWGMARRIRTAVEQASDLDEAFRDALLQDSYAACRFHGLQLFLWTAFSLGLVAATGALTGLYVSQVAGGSLAIASMVGARLQRLVVPARFDVPDSTVWHIDDGPLQLPSPHRQRVFGEPGVQAAALASLQQQLDQMRRLEGRVLTRHTGPWAAWTVRMLLAMQSVPLAAPLLAAVCGRWFSSPAGNPLPTLLAGYQGLWTCQLQLVCAELAQLERRRQALATSEAHTPPSNNDGCETAEYSSELARAHAALLAEARALQARLDVATAWLERPDKDARPTWAAMQASWEIEGPAHPATGPGTAPPRNLDGRALAAVLMAPASYLEDQRTSLVWGAKIGCLQRARRRRFSAPAPAELPS